MENSALRSNLGGEEMTEVSTEIRGRRGGEQLPRPDAMNPQKCRGVERLLLFDQAAILNIKLDFMFAVKN